MEIQSLIKCKEHMNKLKERSMLSEKNTLLNVEEQHTLKIKIWKISNNYLKRKDLMHLWLNKECEIEADLDHQQKLKLKEEEEKWKINTKKKVEEFEKELEMLPGLEAKDIIEKLVILRNKDKKRKINVVKYGVQWIKKASPIDLLVLLDQDTCFPARPQRVRETEDDICLFKL